MGTGEMFAGILDLITMKAVVYDEKTLGAEWEEFDIPADLKSQALDHRSRMLEAISDFDDELMEMVLEGRDDEAPVEKIRSALRKGTINCRITPVLCGSAFKNKGVQRLLDAVIYYLPSPLDIPPVKGLNPHKNREEIRRADDRESFSALAFKIQSDPYVGKLTYLRIYSGSAKTGYQLLNTATGKKERLGRIIRMFANKREDIDEIYAGDIAAVVGLKNIHTGDTLCNEAKPIVLERMLFPEPVISIAIEPKTKADQDQIGQALQKLQEEDPTFKVNADEETGQTIISGMGELHLEIIVERMLREFHVAANVGKPQVAYRETIKRAVRSEGRFIRQTGGHGQYGHIIIDIIPNPKGGFVFEKKITGGVIPKEFIPAVEKGILDAMKSGPLAGYPVNDIKVVLVDGSYHEVDSSELSFRIAGSMALREGLEKAEPVLLEPIMNLEIVVPEIYLGDVMGDLISRRGKIGGIDIRGDGQIIRGEAPLAEMFGYATAIRSLTQGRALFNLEFNHYAEVPEKAAKIFNAIKF
jgi:elongation factor G